MSEPCVALTKQWEPLDAAATACELCPAMQQQQLPSRLPPSRACAIVIAGHCWLSLHLCWPESSSGLSGCAMPPLQVPQTWCNSDIAHLDLSYWAFEILAHPVYGVMPLEFQPVDCTSNTPLTPFTPGFVSKTIYSDLVRYLASNTCCVYVCHSCSICPCTSGPSTRAPHYGACTSSRLALHNFGEGVVFKSSVPCSGAARVELAAILHPLQPVCSSWCWRGRQCGHLHQIGHPGSLQRQWSWRRRAGAAVPQLHRLCVLGAARSLLW